MADFKAQVEGLTSLTILTSPTTTELETFLADGVKDVTERILKFSPQQAASFAGGTDVLDNNGTDLGGAQVLTVVRENGTIGEYVKAARVSPDDRFLVADTSSLSYKSKFHPAFWEFAGKVYIHPAPGSAGDEAYIQHVTYTAPANTDEAIANFPDRYEHLVTLYASIKSLESAAASVELPSDFASIHSPPVECAPPSFSADEASIQNAVSEFTKSLSGIAPSYNNTNSAIGLDSLKTFLSFSSFTTLAPLIYQVEQPLALPNASLAYDGPISTLVQYTDPGTDRIKSAIDLLSPPVYKEQSFALTAWTFNESPDFSSLTAPDPAPLSVFNIDFGTVGEPPSPWDPGDDAETGGGTPYTGIHSDQPLNWTVFNAALLDDDYEKATAELTKIAQMTTLRQDTYGKEMEVYKEKISRIGEQHADVDKTWSMNLAKFSADIAKYQADVNNIYTTWTHDFNRESTKYTQINTQELAKVGQDVTQELNNYAQEKALYDAQITAITKDIDNAYTLAVKNAELEDNLELQNAINAAKKEVDQWQTDLKRYELSMTKYTTDVGNNLERYRTDLNKELDSWKTTQANLLGLHKEDVNEQVKIYEAENAVYQIHLQRDIAELQGKIEASIQKMDLSTNVDLTNKAQKLQGELQVYQSKMDKYVGELQAYEKQVATEVQEYTASVESKKTEYLWHGELAAKLRVEYDTTFQIMVPQQQQAPA